MQKQSERRVEAKNSFGLHSYVKNIRLGPSALVLATFVLLQMFKLLSLLITNKTAENILIIPFQLTVFILPAILYLIYSGGNTPGEMTRGLRLKAPRLYQLPLILSALVLLVFGTIILSLVFAGAGSLEEGFTLYNTFVSRNSGGFFSAVFLVLAYAAVPAVCEELVFRAILSREYEKRNVVCGIIVSSLFFAMLHFDVYMLPVYTFSGIVLALTMYATGSVVASMLVHSLFNAFGLFGQPYLSAFYRITGGTDGLFIFIVCMLVILSSALFCVFASKSYKIRARYSKMPDRKLLPPSDKIIDVISKLVFDPFSIAAVIVYIAVIIIGFLI